MFLKIIHQRIYEKCEENSGEQKFGFTNGFGTREPLCALNVITQRCTDVDNKLYLCFIDYRIAFDCVCHRRLVEILKRIGIPVVDNPTSTLRDVKSMQIYERLFVRMKYNSQIS